MATSTKLKVLPKGHRIIETSHGNYIQKQKQRRTKYKTPAKVRAKMRAAARRAYFPILTGVAVGIPLASATADAGGIARIFTQSGFFRFGRNMLASYTGVQLNGPVSSITASFIPSLMLRGLVPLIGVTLIKRSGIFKGVNTTLAKMRVPLRLS